MHSKVYADHAATTPLCKEAWEAMIPYLREDFGNPSSLHSWARKPKAAISAAREIIASCIGAEPEEIFFTSGGTEADNWVIKGARDGVAVSAYEHHAVLNAAKCSGLPVTYIKPKAAGYVCPKSIDDSLVGVGLVSVMMANNEIGAINPIKDLVAAAHSVFAEFHTDAVQAVGHIPIDVKELGVDYLSASAHKFNGPKGIGFLYVRKGSRITSSLLNGGQQEFGRRAGTENVAAIVGMAAALKKNCEDISTNTNRLTSLANELKTGIRNICSDAIFHGRSPYGGLPGFVSVAFPGRAAEGLMHILDLKGIAVSTGAACDSKNTQISHVLKAIRAPKKLAQSTIRITLGVENTKADVDFLLSVLAKILA